MMKTIKLIILLTQVPLLVKSLKTPHVWTPHLKVQGLVIYKKLKKRANKLSLKLSKKINKCINNNKIFKNFLIFPIKISKAINLLSSNKK